MVIFFEGGAASLPGRKNSTAADSQLPKMGVNTACWLSTVPFFQEAFRVQAQAKPSQQATEMPQRGLTIREPGLRHPELIAEPLFRVPDRPPGP